MEIEEITIDSTIIKFFDDYIVDDKNEIRKKDLDIAVTNAIQKVINK